MAAGTLNRFLLTRIMSHFPQEVKFAFAYGSRVNLQAGNVNPTNMIDFVFAVDDSQEWHERNLKKNPEHYSGLKFFGSNAIARYQDETAAGLYYNTMIKCEKNFIKYGVMNTDTLVRDLNDWDTLYASGRLHKPCLFAKRGSDEVLYKALKQNLHSAVVTASLLLPQSFSEEDLFMAVSQISYQGDFRMTFGENKNKVANIVKPNIKDFREYYKETLETMKNIKWNNTHQVYEQDVDKLCIVDRLKQLPNSLRNHMVKMASKKSTSDVEDVMQRIAQDDSYTNHIQEGLRKIVSQSSRGQSIKAIPAAGLVKSAKYSIRKMSKMWQGRWQSISS